MKLASMRFRNYKGLRNFSVSLQNVNILIGPNNCGKSTILGALRILDQALRVARSKGAERVRRIEGTQSWGYRINENSIPVSLENVHTDCADADSTVEFRLSNENQLILFSPQDGGCVLYWNNPGKPVNSPGAFRKQFPINIQVVPVLGPIEQDEFIVTDETVKRASGTPRACRHFRNYWYKNTEGFPISGN
jgi:hypothetical protein